MRELHQAVPGGLDLNVADDEAFSPDKLRSSLERLYMTVIIGVMGFFTHLARLRSWREVRRSAAFATVYALAWVFDFLMPLMSTLIITLIVYPPSRDFLFPPAPLALISATTGELQKPKAGVLGSTDSATGTPENMKGEAVEAEASTFVTSIASVALASASGKHPADDPANSSNSAADDPAIAQPPDPTMLASSATDARVSAVGDRGAPTQEKAKAPMENAMWSKMRPLMHGINEVSDGWERFANALSPTPPFRKDIHRLRLAGLVVPLLAVSIFVTSYMFMKGVTFGIGFGFFGDPVIQPGLKLLNRKFPNWQKLLEIRNTILKGVPTNAQLTLTLLRVGEANKSPLPPPPNYQEGPPDEVADMDHNELKANLNADHDDLQSALEIDKSVPHEVNGDDVQASKQKSHGKKAGKLLSAFKKSIKGSVETAMGADHLKAKAGSKPSKQRLGVIPHDRTSHLTGPVVFKCRYNGKRGHVYITTKATIPCIGFSLDKKLGAQDADTSLDKDADTLHPQWSVPIGDIKEMKKMGGLGWKAKLVVGWALEREVADGMEILDREGRSFVVTAMILRDELFNRLVSMGGQKWEAC